MDSKINLTNTSKPARTQEQRSAFEMSLKLEFQMDSHSKEAANLKAGEICPDCQSAPIDYDEMLNLSCPNCSYSLAGCFT